MYRKLKSRVLLALFLIIFVVISGTVSYVVVEDFTWLESFYMTMITISTVGFGEVRPLDDAGRILTIVLIVTNLVIVAYAISSISRYFLEGDFLVNYKLNKMKQRVSRLKSHVIVCGYGRNGREACATLQRHHIPYVVIEKNEASFNDAELPENLHYVVDDATHDHVLIEAGIEHARALITTLPNDSENVFVVLTARELSRQVLIISRASLDTSVSKLRRAGAGNIIMPDKLGGAHMASLVVNPDVNEFIDLITGQSGSEIHLEEIALGNLKNLHGSTIRELNIRHSTGVNVIGLKHPDGTYVVNPEVDMKLNENMKLILLGTHEQMNRLKQMG